MKFLELDVLGQSARYEFWASTDFKLREMEDFVYEVDISFTKFWFWGIWRFGNIGFIDRLFYRLLVSLIDY